MSELARVDATPAQEDSDVVGRCQGLTQGGSQLLGAQYRLGDHDSTVPGDSVLIEANRPCPYSTASYGSCGLCNTAPTNSNTAPTNSKQK
jgi:hypothetical protein